MSSPVAPRSGLDAETARLVAESLRKMFAAGRPGAGLAAALSALGWEDALAADRGAATTLLFTEHGRALARSRLLDQAMLDELAADLPASDLPGRALLLPLGTGAPPVPGTSPAGVLTGDLSGVTEVVVPVLLDGGPALSVMPASLLRDRARPASGFDSAGWLLVEDTPDARAGTAVLPGGSWERAVAVGRLALAAEIIGVCAAALDLAVRHTTARVQFGRRLAAYQAVRHRLAEAHVAVESAHGTVAAAWRALTDRGDPRVARLAKARAGWAQAEVMRHALQVCGAIGLSREFPLHRYVSRAAVLDGLLGSHRTLVRELGEELLAGAEPDPVGQI